ncbi:MAG: DUF1285 domain-containing protein [Alphaproteobacteria bacterium]|nr:DUF1285 domain-containing protein [Alphaproteobacteria bacterium]
MRSSIETLSPRPVLSGHGDLRVNCGDLEIRIDRDGVWQYRGSPMDRQEMVCLFASLLTRHADGTYWLETPTEAGRIQVDDVPFLIVDLFVAGRDVDQVVSFRTNVDEIVTLDAEHPLRIKADSLDRRDMAPYVMVRGGLEARLTRSVYHELVTCGVTEKIGHEVVYGIWSSGAFFPIGSLDPEG